MKWAWLDWYANALKIGLAALVVFGLYGWAQDSAAKHEAVCGVLYEAAESTVAVEGAEDWTEYRRLQRVYDDECSGPVEESES
ncbi:hypothetical protein [Pseudomonas sp. A2]|uniref:hypothetical protein n=1 Tax=Pseudomonas sp. A2 TaxID=107445 RepID=UPI001FFE5546|nr:hypothetical protein [Pseudomonas sp. A2]UPK87342.1 hypothetical protein E5221_21245 [Pseudomonas sp. A2]